MRPLLLVFLLSVLFDVVVDSSNMVWEGILSITNSKMMTQLCDKVFKTYNSTKPSAATIFGI